MKARKKISGRNFEHKNKKWNQILKKQKDWNSTDIRHFHNQLSPLVFRYFSCHSDSFPNKDEKTKKRKKNNKKQKIIIQIIWI